MRKNVVLKRCRNGGAFSGVLYGVRLWCFSILAPSAPILLRPFLRRSIAEIHSYRSVQKRAPTDQQISSYDAIKLVRYFFSTKNVKKKRIYRFSWRLRRRISMIDGFPAPSAPI